MRKYWQISAMAKNNEDIDSQANMLHYCSNIINSLKTYLC